MSIEGIIPVEGFRYTSVNEEITLQELEGREEGTRLLIKDSKGNSVAIVDLVGLDALYSKADPTRIRVQFPKRYYIQVNSDLNSVLLTPRRMET